MNIVIPIHKKWADKILLGQKQYELRKVLPVHLRTGDVVYLYETSPVSLVVGYFIVNGIDEVSIGDLIEELDPSVYGFQRTDFIQVANMFRDTDPIYAIEIHHPKRFFIPLPIERFTGKRFAPQSYVYTSPSGQLSLEVGNEAR